MSHEIDQLEFQKTSISLSFIAVFHVDRLDSTDFFFCLFFAEYRCNISHISQYNMILLS